MLVPVLAILFGFVVLVWSADRFVEGSAVVARRFGMSPLLIGMVIVGFGTSMPELLVSSLASLQNAPGIALGNAYGSNICNIALILGLTSLIAPIPVTKRAYLREMPILIGVTALAAVQVSDGIISRGDAFFMLAVFCVLMILSVRQDLKLRHEPFGDEVAKEVKKIKMTIKQAVMWVVVGLGALIVSSRILVWASVDIAHSLGISDLVIGLTIVAVGTSLPELASSLVAAYKKEHDIALGNILGSNFFNTLVVVGLAGVINPMDVPREIITRDIPVMAVVTVLLFIMGFGYKKQGRINRYEGAVLLSAFSAYTTYLVVAG